MPKPRIERMQDYLDESRSLSEKLEKIGAICADDMNLYDDEKALISDTLRDIFVPTKEENGVKVFDKEKAAENIKELQRFKADLVAKRGQERVMWLRYFDKKDGPNISVDGRNENINRAIDMSNMSGNYLIFNAMSGAITGLFDGELPPMDGSPDNTEEYIKTEVFRQPDMKDFVNEGQEIYYKIGSMESKKLKEVSPEQKEADKKLFGEYNNYVQSFFSNGNNAPWYNDEEIKEIIEKQSGKQVTYDKNVIDPIMSEVMTYKEVNIKEEYGKNLSTFMEPDKYNTGRRLAVFKKLSEGKKLSEIKVSADDIKAASEMYAKCKDGQMTQEITDILAKAVYVLEESNLAIVNETDKEKIDEYLRISKDLSEFHTGFDMDTRDWGRTRSHILADEIEFQTLAVENGNRKMMQNEYGLSSDEKNMNNKDMDILLRGGFRNTALNRMTSVGFTAYAYKILNTPEENRPNGYNPDFGKDCGKEYLSFMEKYPVFEEINKPIKDKEKLKENVKKHAEFYRKWGEMLAKEPLEDFTNPEKLRDPKVIKRAHYLNQMAIEFSQNSENYRRNEETRALFMESFGGEEYYERLTNVVGLHQTIGLSVMTYANPSKEISARAGALSFLTECNRRSGSIEGKTVMDLDPSLYSFTNCGMYTGMAITPFLYLSSTEVTDYLDKGKFPKTAKKDIEEIFNTFDDEKAPKIRKDQMKLKKEMSGEKWTLVDELLTKPVEKREPKYDRSPLANMDVSTEFSKELVDKFYSLGKVKDDIEASIREFAKNHGSMDIPSFLDGVKAEEDGIKKGFDERNVSDFVYLLMEPGLTEEQRKEFTRDFCEKFYSSEEERNKLLDKVYDKFDNFDVRNYDLSCINGTDKGEKGPDGLTNSERDFTEYMKFVKCEQAFRTTRYGFRDYFGKRYGDVEKVTEYLAKDQELMSGSLALASMLMHNEIDLNSLKYHEQGDIIYTDQASHTKGSMMKEVADMQRKLSKGEIEPEKCNGVVKLGYAVNDDPEARTAIGGALIANVGTVSDETSLGYALKQTYKWGDYDNLYIDGVRATEFAEPFLTKDDNVGNVIDRIAMNGKHRLEVVSYGINNDGNITPIINTFEPYGTEFYENDPGREGRISKIREDVGKRLGPERKFYNLIKSSDLELSEDVFENMADKCRTKENPEPRKSFEDEILQLKGELKAIDTWYHRNSKEFKDTLEALEHPENTKALLDACNAYINKYARENESFERKTDLGNARISKIMEIKCLVKDKEFEDKNKVFEGISRRKQERINRSKENVKADTLLKEEQKESGAKVKNIGKTEISKNGAEKSNKEVGKVK